MDRRDFLKAGLGAATYWALSSCTNDDSPDREAPIPSDGPEAPANLTAPASRVTLRLPGGEVGFPSPFTYSPASYSIVAFIYDTLLQVDATGKLVPWLASRHEVSGDGLTHTFELRDNVRWHDGTPFGAEDVVFSFDYFKAHQARLPPFVLFRPDNVVRVRATGPHAVQVRLDKPAITFPRSVAAPFPIVPRHIWSAIANPTTAQDDKVLVGTGPYRLQSYERGRGSYLLVANDDFFLGKPFVQRLEFRPVGDQIAALLAGEIDAAGFGLRPPSRRLLDRLRDNPEIGVLGGPYDFPTILYFDLTKGGAIADVRFRRACAHAIDRNDMVRRLLAGEGAVGNPGFLPPDHPFHVKVEQYPYDPGLANRLLDEAGYKRPAPGQTRQGPNGAPLRFRLAVIPELAAAVQVVRGALEALGMELILDPVEALQQFSGTFDYDMAVLLHGNVSADPDFMRIVLSSRQERRFFGPKGFRDAEFDDLADKQLVTRDEAERRRLVARMQEILARELPYLHLYYPRPLHVFRRGVFDQWSYAREGGGPYNKQVLVTGTKAGGTSVRATR